MTNLHYTILQLNYRRGTNLWWNLSITNIIFFFVHKSVNSEFFLSSKSYTVKWIVHRIFIGVISNMTKPPWTIRISLEVNPRISCVSSLSLIPGIMQRTRYENTSPFASSSACLIIWCLCSWGNCLSWGLKTRDKWTLKKKKKRNMSSICL